MAEPFPISVDSIPDARPRDLDNGAKRTLNLRLNCRTCGYVFAETDPLPHVCPVCHPGGATPLEAAIILLYDKVCLLIAAWWHQYTASVMYPLIEDLKEEHIGSILKFMEQYGVKDVAMEIKSVEKDRISGNDVMTLQCFYVGAGPESKALIGDFTLVFHTWFSRVMRWLYPLIRHFTDEERTHLTIVLKDATSAYEKSVIALYVREDFVALHEVPDNLPVQDINRTLAQITETSKHG